MNYLMIAQISEIISREADTLYKDTRETPQWARDNGLEFNEEHHRWMNPNTGEVHEHPENDDRWEESIEVPGEAPRLGLKWNSKTGKWNRSATNEEFTHEELTQGEKDPEDVNKVLSDWFKQEMSTRKFISGTPIDKKRRTEIPDEIMQMSMRKADKEESKIKEHPNYFDIRESFSVNYYVYNSWLINMNVANGKPDDEGKEIASKMRSIGKSQTLFRGLISKVGKVHVDTDKLEIGSKISLKSFTSTSRDPSMAYSFAARKGSEKGTMLIIDTPEDASGITLGNDDVMEKQRTNHGQYETILNYGQSLEILGIAKWKGMPVLYSRVISNSQNM